MSLNPKCPKCGSNKVRLTTEKSKHGFLWLFLFGMVYGMWWLFKATIAMCVFICFDWWYAIIKSSDKKGHIWLSKRIMENKSRTFYCEECHHNFKG